MRTVLLDACVLYPAPLRDLLLSLGTHCPIELRWSALIQDEWTRSLLEKRSDLTRAQVERTRSFMDQALPNALVTGFESLVASLVLPDPDDRHVLAAAIHAKADAIITRNLKDFPAKTLKAHHLSKQTPDDFIMEVIAEHEVLVVEAIRGMRVRLRNPSVSSATLLETFTNQGLTRVVAHLRQPNLLSRL